MLPARHRLILPVPWSRSGDIHFSTPLFKLVAQHNSLNITRVGFIITTKVGKAHERNSLKRKLGALFQSKWSTLDKAVDIIIVAYPQILNASDEELSSSLDKALSKIPLA